jgi:hypothetical protein
MVIVWLLCGADSQFWGNLSSAVAFFALQLALAFVVDSTDHNCYYHEYQDYHYEDNQSAAQVVALNA